MKKIRKKAIFSGSLIVIAVLILVLELILIPIAKIVRGLTPKKGD